MANVTQEVAQVSGRLSQARRWHPEADHSALEADLVAARIAHYAEKLAADAPPLTDEQIEKIGAVIRSASHQGGGRA